MAGSVTDLSGFFRNDEDNLTAQLTTFYNGLKPREYPSKISIQVKIAGSASFESLLKDDRGTARSIVIAEKPTDIGLIIAEIEGALTSRYGPNPTGFSLRIRASKSGMAASPDVDMTRKIIAGEGSEVEGSAQLWKEMYERKLVEYTELHRLYIELVKATSVMFNSATIQNAEQAKTIGALGTARAAGTAANDYGGLTTIIGLFAMAWLLPQIKMALGLPSSSDLVQVGKAVQGLLMTGKVPPGIEATPERRGPPPAALSPSSPSSPASLPAPSPETSDGLNLDQIVEKAKSNDDFLTDLKNRIKADPELLAKVLS